MISATIEAKERGYEMRTSDVYYGVMTKVITYENTIDMSNKLGYDLISMADECYNQRKVSIVGLVFDIHLAWN